jgi:hypothetical protein
MATAGRKVASAEAKGVLSTVEEARDVREELDKCGECKKVVGKGEKGVQCEICEIWFHCRCEEVEEDTYKLLRQSKVHFFCGRCDRAAGKILKTVVELKEKQNRMEKDINKIKAELGDIKQQNYVKQEQLEDVARKLTADSKGEVSILQDEIKKLKNDVVTVQDGSVKLEQMFNEDKGSGHDEPWSEVVKKEVATEISIGMKTVMEDVEETLDIERRKGNLIIHGVPEKDAEEDIESVIQVFGQGMSCDFSRHVEKMERIGRHSGARPRPIRMIMKSMDSCKQILSRAKDLKHHDDFKRMIITPDLTKRQLATDKELRLELKRIRDSGETDVKIKFGKIIKKESPTGREVVVYVPQVT